MTTASRCFRPAACRVGAWLAVAGALLLAGCGSPPPRISPAKKHLEAAQSAVEDAEREERGGKVEPALAAYRRAQEQIAEGIKKAQGAELDRFRMLRSSVDPKVTDLAYRKEQADVVAQQKKLAEEREKQLALVKTVDPAEMEKKKQAEAKARMEEAKARLAKVTEVATARVEKKADAEAGTDTKAEVDPDAEAKDNEKPAPPKPVVPAPYRDQGAQQPAISVDAVKTRAEFALAYVQIFNKDTTNRVRIARIQVTFRDAGNGELMDADAVFVHEHFNPNAKNLLDDQEQKPGVAVTGSSHEVQPAHRFLVVAVGADKNKGPRAKRATATVIWEDQREASDTGPATIVEDAVIPGLR